MKKRRLRGRSLRLRGRDRRLFRICWRVKAPANNSTKATLKWHKKWNPPRLKSCRRCISSLLRRWFKKATTVITKTKLRNKRKIKGLSRLRVRRGRSRVAVMLLRWLVVWPAQLHKFRVMFHRTPPYKRAKPTSKKQSNCLEIISQGTVILFSMIRRWAGNRILI